MGCGKTTIGRRLSKRLNVQFADLDHLIEARENRLIPEIFSTDGEEKFRKIEQSVLNETFKYDDIVVATGGGTPCFFDNMEQINKNGISIYLYANIGTLINRLMNAQTPRPLIKGKSKSELSEFIIQSLTKREPFYQKAYFTIDSQTLNLTDVIKLIKSLSD
jgi:shikimate kinase